MTAEQKLRKMREDREHELGRKRQQILHYLERRPKSSIEQITVAVGYKYGLRDLLSTLQAERHIEETGGAWSLAKSELEEEVEQAAKPEQLRGGRGRSPRRDQLVSMVATEPGLTTQEIADRLRISTKVVHMTCRAAELHAVPVARRPGPRGLIRETCWYPKGSSPRDFVVESFEKQEVPHGLTAEPSAPALGPEPSSEGSSASSTAGGQLRVDPPGEFEALVKESLDDSVRASKVFHDKMWATDDADPATKAVIPKGVKAPNALVATETPKDRIPAHRAAERPPLEERRVAPEVTERLRDRAKEVGLMFDEYGWSWPGSEKRLVGRADDGRWWCGPEASAYYDVSWHPTEAGALTEALMWAPLHPDRFGVQRQLVEAQARIAELEEQLSETSAQLQSVRRLGAQLDHDVHLVQKMLDELLGPDRLDVGLQVRLGVLWERFTANEVVGG
jgi:hypothetical protein